MSPKAPTFGENPFQALWLYALGCRSSLRDVLPVCSRLFYCFPGAKVDTGLSLGEHQGRMLPAIKEVIEEIEKEAAGGETDC